MANKEELINAKAKVQEEISQRVKENPNIGIYEFAKQELSVMGVDTTKIKTGSEINEAIKTLPPEKKKILGKDLKAYQKDYNAAIKQMNDGLYSGIKELPKKALDVIVKGAGIGISVASVINTIAPGLFSTGLGYIAGSKVIKSTLANLGLISMGIFTPTELTSKAIVLGGAVAGAAIYTAGKLGVKAIKGIHNKVKNKNDEMDR